MLIEMKDTETDEVKTIDLLDDEKASEALGDMHVDLLVALQMGGVTIIDDKVFMPIPRKQEKR